MHIIRSRGMSDVFARYAFMMMRQAADGAQAVKKKNVSSKRHHMSSVWQST